MTTANDHLKSIQSRIDELEHTISERGEQLRKRTTQLKEDLQEELSPEELIRKHPFQATGGALVAGLLVGRAVRSLFSPRHRAAVAAPEIHLPATVEASAMKVALGAVGAELIHAGKDLAISWLKSYIDEKKKRPA
ncbi:MAG: hypothetical protein HGB01_07500 [Chlorobiaceae bacterium]|nr:hypothetical protein [Chlorobiaceae bacterium]NTV26041.1 hypothetical protein [Chlorobiaceae bacterium]